MILPRIGPGKPPLRAAVSRSSRDPSLEALRGIAALVVVAWHFFLGFAPGILTMPGLRGTPFFAFVHGSAAVGVFFVLSGYVLTRRYFETGQKRLLIIGALKRWFRLFLPVFLSVMLSWLLFHFNLYAYPEAGSISGSNWLSSFGLAMNPPFEPTFLLALWDGFSEAFSNNHMFNPLLWTIHIEFMGSYIAFAFAALITGLRGHNRLIALMLLATGLLVHFIEPWLFAFLIGTLLAFYAPRLKALDGPVAFALLVVGITFLGYREPIGFYAFLNFLTPINGEALRTYTATVGAVLLMISFIGYEPLRRALRGRMARLLGRMSFPIYLVHLLLIFSLGSTVFVYAKDSNSYGVALFISALALVPTIVVLAALFAVIDVKWVTFVNKIFRRIKIAD